MKVITYMCENCFEPHVFNPSDSNDDDIYICPKCGEKMMYFGTEEIDPTTNKVVNRYNEENRNRNNPGKSVSIKSQITCPFCKSTNVRKIGVGERAFSVLGLGLLSKKINKSFKCSNCGGTF